VENPTFDITKPAAIRAALPAIEAEMQRHEAAFREANREWQRWADLRAKVEALVEAAEALYDTHREGESEKRIANTRPEPAQTRAVRIVKENDGPMTVAAVDERMPDVKRKTVGWALWNAVREGELEKLGQGLYAPPGFIQGQEPLVTSPNGANRAAEDEL
jgi:hypothetical protein